MNWDDLRVVLAISREGSLSGAAKVLGTSHSTVFRQTTRVKALMEHLHACLSKAKGLMEGSDSQRLLFVAQSGIPGLRAIMPQSRR